MEQLIDFAITVLRGPEAVNGLRSEAHGEALQVAHVIGWAVKQVKQHLLAFQVLVRDVSFCSLYIEDIVDHLMVRSPKRAVFLNSLSHAETKGLTIHLRHESSEIAEQHTRTTSRNPPLATSCPMYMSGRSE